MKCLTRKKIACTALYVYDAYSMYTSVLINERNASFICIRILNTCTNYIYLSYCVAITTVLYFTIDEAKL